MRVLLITENSQSLASISLRNAFEKRKHTITIIKPSQLVPLVSDRPSGFDLMYTKQAGDVNRLMGKQYDLFFPRIAGNLQYSTMILRHLQNNVGIFSPIPIDGLLVASNKFLTLQKCSQVGLRTPRSILYTPDVPVEHLINKVGSLPIVAKFLTGSQGRGISIFDTLRGARSGLESFNKAGIPILIQEFLPSGGKDLRIFVVDNQVIAS